MRDDQLALLSNIAYLNLPRGRGYPMQMSYFLRYHENNRRYSEFADTIYRIRQDPDLNNLTIVGHINDNRDSGVVAFAFETLGGAGVFAFRGSDPLFFRFARDNINDERTTRVAYNFVNKTLGRNDFNEVYATGHSKGGMLAQYVTLRMPQIDGTAVFNSKPLNGNIVRRLGNEIPQSIREDGENRITNFYTPGDRLIGLADGIMIYASLRGYHAGAGTQFGERRTLEPDPNDKFFFIRLNHNQRGVEMTFDNQGAFSHASDTIKVNTYQLRCYADKLDNIAERLREIENRVERVQNYASNSAEGIIQRGINRAKQEIEGVISFFTRPEKEQKIYFRIDTSVLRGASKYMRRTAQEFDRIETVIKNRFS